MGEIMKGQCSCGSIVVESIQAPLFRAYCHCSLCREYNKTSYADVIVFTAKDVSPVDEHGIKFKAYKKPPLVQRGTCTQCGQAVLEKVSVPLMPKLTIIPSSMITNKSQLPDPVMHMFYDKRVEDSQDEVKKYQGFMASQLAFSGKLMKSLLTRQK